MFIFVPSTQFDHERITAVRLSRGEESQISDKWYPAHLTIETRSEGPFHQGRLFYFEGDEALTVIDQLWQAGFYTEEQHQQVRALMASYLMADMASGR
jgi:hypothetical protein